MGYTATRKQRVQLLVAIRRMPWRDCCPKDHSRYLTSPALRTVGAAILATAAEQRCPEGVVRPRRHLVRIGVAQLPGSRRVIGLDDGTIRHYLLDLGSEAISVPVEPTGAPTPCQNSGPSPTNHLDCGQVCGPSAAVGGGSQ